MRLRKKVAIVTGGGAGIGRAISELFAEEGAKVVIADIDLNGGKKTESLIRDMNGDASFIETDISNEANVQSLVNHAVSIYGAVDILINNAAAFVFGEIQDVTDTDWEKVFGVNLIGSSYCVRNVIPIMSHSGGGAIVNIASVSGFVAQPGFIPYNVSKGAVMQLTRSLAMDLASKNIRVNCVCPGAVKTQASELHRKFVGQDQKTFDEQAANSNFLKRVAQPREIAYGALFLASGESSFMTGASLVIDGGATAQ